MLPRHLTSAQLISISILLIDLTCVALFVPLLPFYAMKKIGMSPATFQLAQSAYGVTQLASSTIVGARTDRWTGEVRRLLVLSSLGAAMSYAVSGNTQSVLLFIVARLAVGAVKQTTTLVRIYTSRSSAHADRSASLATLSAAEIAPFMVVPALAGRLASDWLEGPAILASLGLVANAIVIWVLLPPLPAHTDAPSSSSTAKDVPGVAAPEPASSSRSPDSTWTLLTSVSVRVLMGVYFLVQLASMLCSSNFDLILLTALPDLSPASFGLISSVGACTRAASSLLLVPWLSHRLTDIRQARAAVVASASISVVAILTYPLVPTTTEFHRTMFFALLSASLSLCQSIHDTSLLSRISKGTSTSTGTLLGLADSLSSASRIIAPTVGGIILGASDGGSGGFRNVFIAVGSVYAAAAAAMMV
jgi:DHA1 family tetracycline resistance protein-like MFS transporter